MNHAIKVAADGHIKSIELKEAVAQKQPLQHNQQYCQETIQLYRESMVCIAERLWHIRAEERWTGMYESFEDFLENMGMKKGTASKLCSLYERIVIELKFPTETLHSAPWSKLYDALPMMKDSETAKYAFAAAATLTSKEIMQVRYEHKHGCECPHKNTSLLRHCLDCKTYMKVHEQL